MQHPQEAVAANEVTPPLGTLPNPDDEQTKERELAVRASRGDTDALGVLYEMHVDVVFRYVHLRVRNQADAENLTQETWLRVARTIRNYEPRAPFGAWVQRIARNLVTDHFRTQARRPLTLAPEMLALDIPELAPSPAEHAERRDLARRLTNLLASLAPAQQKCVILRFYVGMSVAETAELMGRNEQAIKSLQHRALARLGALMGNRNGSTRNQSHPGDVNHSADGSAEVGGDW